MCGDLPSPHRTGGRTGGGTFGRCPIGGHRIMAYAIRSAPRRCRGDIGPYDPSIGPDWRSNCVAFGCQPIRHPGSIQCGDRPVVFRLGAGLRCQDTIVFDRCDDRLRNRREDCGKGRRWSERRRLRAVRVVVIRATVVRLSRRWSGSYRIRDQPLTGRQLGMRRSLACRHGVGRAIVVRDHRRGRRIVRDRGRSFRRGDRREVLNLRHCRCRYVGRPPRRGFGVCKRSQGLACQRWPRGRGLERTRRRHIRAQRHDRRLRISGGGLIRLRSNTRPCRYVGDHRPGCTGDRALRLDHDSGCRWHVIARDRTCDRS